MKYFSSFFLILKLNPAYAFSLSTLAISLLMSAIVFFKRGVPLYIKYFFPFLLITALFEAMGYYMERKWGNNHVVYNMFVLISFPVTFLIIRQIVCNNKVKTYLLYAIIIYPIIAFISLLPSPLKHPWSSTNWEIGAIVVITFVIYYFYELFKFPGHGKLFREPAIWVGGGMLIFYAITFPLFSVNNFMGGFPESFLYDMFIIVNILNGILNSFFTVAFICALRDKRGFGKLTEELHY